MIERVRSTCLLLPEMTCNPSIILNPPHTCIVLCSVCCCVDTHAMRFMNSRILTFDFRELSRISNRSIRSYAGHAGHAGRRARRTRSTSREDDDGLGEQAPYTHQFTNHSSVMTSWLKFRYVSSSIPIQQHITIFILSFFTHPRSTCVHSLV